MHQTNDNPTFVHSIHRSLPTEGSIVSGHIIGVRPSFQTSKDVPFHPQPTMAPTSRSRAKPKDDSEDGSSSAQLPDAVAKPPPAKKKASPVKQVASPRRSVTYSTTPKSEIRNHVHVTATRTGDIIAWAVARSNNMSPAFCRPGMVALQHNPQLSEATQVTIVTYKRGGEEGSALDALEKRLKVKAMSKPAPIFGDRPETDYAPLAIFVRVSSGPNDKVSEDRASRLKFANNIVNILHTNGIKVTSENQYKAGFMMGSDLTPADNSLRPYLGDYLRPRDFIDCMQAVVFPGQSPNDIVLHERMRDYWSRATYGQFMQESGHGLAADPADPTQQNGGGVDGYDIEEL